jgi:hypothetical protein
VLIDGLPRLGGLGVAEGTGPGIPILHAKGFVQGPASSRWRSQAGAWPSPQQAPPKSSSRHGPIDAAAFCPFSKQASYFLFDSRLIIRLR